jgi:hypothetical protein
VEGANPLIIILMFVLRCGVPLLIMLGISYLLKRLGLLKEPPQPPADHNSGNGYGREKEGNWMHGKA